MAKAKRVAADERTSRVAGFDEITCGGPARGRITFGVEVRAW